MAPSARDGAVLFGLPGSPGRPVPQVEATPQPRGETAARAYLHNLHADLAGTGVYAGLWYKVAGLGVDDGDAAKFVTENWGLSHPAETAEPGRPRRRAVGSLPQAATGFEEVVGLPAAA